MSLLDIQIIVLLKVLLTVPVERVCALMGATLVLAIVNAVYMSAPDIPLR